MPTIETNYIEVGALLPVNALPTKGDVTRLLRKLRADNPCYKKYTNAMLISDAREAIIASYKRLHHQLQGSVLLSPSSIYNKINNLWNDAKKVINKIAGKALKKKFLQDSISLFDIFQCR